MGLNPSELAAKTSHRELVHSKTHDTTPPQHHHHQLHSGTGREEEGGRRFIKHRGKNRFLLTALGRYTSAESRAMNVSVQSHIVGGFCS